MEKRTCEKCTHFKACNEINKKCDVPFNDADTCVIYEANAVESASSKNDVSKREIWEFIKKLILFAVLALVSSFAPALQGLFVNIFDMSISAGSAVTGMVQAGVATAFLSHTI